MIDNDIIIKLKEGLSGVNDGGITFDNIVNNNRKIDNLVENFIQEEYKKAIEKGERFVLEDNYGKVIEIDKDGEVVFKRDL